LYILARWALLTIYCRTALWSTNVTTPIFSPLHTCFDYRWKTYPEIFAVITGSFGVGCEAIEADGGRYRFDACDWLASWFPATYQGG
jgi:hypothetical protein